MWQVKVSHKSEMAGPFNRGDTIINKHFTLLFLYVATENHFQCPLLHLLTILLV